MRERPCFPGWQNYGFLPSEPRPATGGLALPAWRVPMPATVCRGFHPGGVIDRPDNKVCGADWDHLLAAGAPVRLPGGRAGHGAHQEIAVAGLLRDPAAQGGGICLVLAPGRPPAVAAAAQRSVRASRHPSTVARRTPCQDPRLRRGRLSPAGSPRGYFRPGP
jgi:hypothetical protein